jgi:hypothetical protein
MAILIVGCVFVLVGAPFIWLALRRFRRDGVSARWPRAEGAVTAASLTSSRHRVTDQRTGLHSYQTMYTPKVRYTYRVGDEDLEGTSIALAVDDVAMSETAAKTILERYRTGTQVSVLYDPADPKTAHLEVRRSVGAIILLCFGALWIAIGSLVLVAWARS